MNTPNPQGRIGSKVKILMAVAVLAVLAILWSIAADDEPEYKVIMYQGAFMACGGQPDSIYYWAETRDVEKAARWYSNAFSVTNVPEPANVEGKYRGCFDALSGKPSKHVR